MTQPVAVVSGSTAGLGLCIAQTLLEAGYYVYINGRDANTADAAVQQLRSVSNDVALLRGDVAEEVNYTAWREQITAHHQQIDLVVANAGTGRYSNALHPDKAEFDAAMQANFYSGVAWVQGFSELLSDAANIVFINSIAGVQPLGAPIVYASAKAALLMYAKELAIRFAPHGVRVNTISPGNLMFPGSTWEDKLQNNTAATLEYIAQNVPLNDFVTPEAIANMVLHIANSRALTGQNLIIDGGQTARG